MKPNTCRSVPSRNVALFTHKTNFNIYMKTYHSRMTRNNTDIPIWNIESILSQKSIDNLSNLVIKKKPDECFVSKARNMKQTTRNWFILGLRNPDIFRQY